MTIGTELIKPITSLQDARDRAALCLNYLAGLKASDVTAASGLVLRTVLLEDGRSVALRPLNTNLFIPSVADYTAAFETFESLIAQLRDSLGDIGDDAKEKARETRIIGRALYTTLQAIGFGMDCALAANQARKNFGMRFEELVRDLLFMLGLGNSPVNFALPYRDASGTDQTFRNQVDLVISPNPPVGSTPTNLHPDDVVVSIKTSSKDRFAKIFLDQEMLRFVTKQDVPMLALFHNDVQRSGSASTSVTFVAGNFTAYVERFGPPTGTYYVDPPLHILREPWSKWLRTFDDLLLDDLWGVVFGR